MALCAGDRFDCGRASAHVEDTMQMTTITSELIEQYDRAWAMLRATIERITDERWRSGDAPGLVPARWALHAIETVAFYMRPTPDGFRWNARFGVDSDAPADRLPSRADVLAYLEEVRADARATLERMSDSDLLEATNAFPWTGSTILGRMLYTLRHTMTHQGELSMILRFQGADETEWR
jgi:hypothetical protein